MSGYDQFLKLWPIVVSIVLVVAAMITTYKYRIPEIVRRLEKLESRVRPSSDDFDQIVGRVYGLEKEEHPTNRDLDRIVANFQTVCKFNQVSCQKMNTAELAKLRKEMDTILRKEIATKFSSLTDLLHAQAVLLARLDERIAHLSNQEPVSDQSLAASRKPIEANTDGGFIR